MIHEIAPYQFDNQYNEASPDADSFVIFVQGSTVLIHDDGQAISCPRHASLECFDLPLTYLFTVDEKRFFLSLVGDCIDDMPAGVQAAVASLLREGYGFHGAILLRQRSPQWFCFACAVALQLGRWYADNRFCGRCAAPLRKSADERALACGQCGKVVYPKICPAVIVGVIDGDRILLTQYAGSEPNRRFALIAGFTEVGETLEETVQREVMEEVGVRVRNIRYYKNQPWPFTDTLLAGFFCELDGSPEITMDARELSVAKWVSRNDMDVPFDGISLTNEMMVLFKDGKLPA